MSEMHNLKQGQADVESVEEHIAHGDPDFSVNRVPQEARVSKYSLQMAYWAVISALFSMVFSSVLADTYGAMNTFVGTGAAAVVLGICAGIISKCAIRTGMSVDVFSRTVFGKSGGLLATVLVFGCLTLFAVIESSIIAEALHSYFAVLKPWHAYLIVVMFSAPIAFGRISSYLDKLNGFLLPLFVLGMIYIVASAIDHGGYSNSWFSYGPDGGRIDARCMPVFFLWALGGAQLLAAMDYGRFGKPKDEKYNVRITFGIPLFLLTYSVNGAIGIFITSTVSSKLGGLNSDTAAVGAILALTGLAGVLFIVVSQVRINTLNYQLATVNLQAFLKHLGLNITKVLSAVMVGGIVFLFMLKGVLATLPVLLGYLAIFVGSWCAIAIVHITVIGHEEITAGFIRAQAKENARFWDPSTFIWLFASGLGLASKEWWSTTDYSIPVAIAAGAILHAIYLKYFSRTSRLTKAA